jgi:DNA-binding GntR family transcriptional regulator
MAGAVEKAYTAVRQRILRGAYRPSARITEQEISDAAGVSRTPAREALRRLEAEGFVRLVPNQGAIVTDWTDADVEDIFELRAMLESYGAMRAAQRITPEGVAELSRLAVDQHRESAHRTRGYLQRIGAINSEFHRTLHRFAASPRLITALNSLIEAPLILQTFSSYRDEDLVRSAAHHLEIVSALEAHDGEWAAAVMRAHVMAARCALRPKVVQRTPRTNGRDS